MGESPGPIEGRPRETRPLPCLLNPDLVRAGIVVIAASAVSGCRPRLIAIPTCLRKSPMLSRPSVVKQIGIPASASLAGFSGARSQCIRSSSDVFRANALVFTLGVLGKSTGTRIGRFIATNSLSPRYSRPLPRTIMLSENSRATLSARTAILSFCASMTNVSDVIALDRTSSARLVSGRGNSRLARYVSQTLRYQFHLLVHLICRSNNGFDLHQNQRLCAGFI